MDTHSAEPPKNPNACMVCGKSDHPEDLTKRICNDCRTNLTRLNIPKWVKAFALGVVALTLVDAVRVPRFLLAGIHYQRGENAQDQNHYATAEKEFKYVADIFPGSIENNAKLVISSVHNMDFGEIDVAVKNAGRQTSDEEGLVEEANSCLEMLDVYIPGKGLDSLVLNRFKYPDTVYCDSLNAFALRNPGDNVAKYFLADKLFDLEEYKKSDSVLQYCVKYTPKNIFIIQLMAAIKRESKQYDSAIYFYNEMLDWNAESVAAISGKARVELKRHNDAIALQLAQQAYLTDSSNALSLEALAMVYYYSNKQAQANGLLTRIKQDGNPEDSVVYNRLDNILTGKTIFR
jgi:tetratricopeptide (TPR) repeat protein